MADKKRKPRKLDLCLVAKILGIYITQDKDGFISIWKDKPSLNSNAGYWEHAVQDSILIEPIIEPYSTNWEKSLITPRTMEGLMQNPNYKYKKANK